MQNDSWAMTLSDAAGNTLRQSQNLVYAYNDQGRLGQKTYNSNGKPDKAQYWVWLDGQPIAGIELEYSGKGAVNKTSQYYLHSDHLNTPRMATNHNQALLWSWNSDAFGTGSVNGNAHGNKTLLDMPLRFPGQIYDAHTAMNYNYFRDYDPNTGRYIQSDPIGLQGGINTYNYVGGNPITRKDPSGLYWFRQPWQTPGFVGRPNTVVPPGGAISEGIEQYAPAGYTFGVMHDGFVDAATSAGIPDWIINIPSMIPVYGAAVVTEGLRTIGILNQPTPPAQPTQCK